MMFSRKGEYDEMIRGKRQAIKRDPDLSNIWKDGVRYYFDDSVISNEMIKEFNSAVEAWRQDTCIDFTEVDSRSEDDRIRVTTEYNSCSSHVGKRGGEQLLMLGEGCETFGHIAHELGHALGLLHTMQRYDRDDYITVVQDSLKNIYYAAQFGKHPQETNENYRIGYDYGSIMNYRWRNIFSDYKPSLLPHDERYRFTMGSEMISFADLSMINEHYFCKEICREAGNAIVCENGGFPHPRNCSRCLCPGGYGGDNCTQRPDDGCGKEVQATSNWQKIKLVFANDKKEYLDGYRKCTYWITSPKNTRIEVEFYSNHFGLEEDSCATAGVEIKTNKDQTLTGYRLCSTDANGWKFTSYTNIVPVITYTRDFLPNRATIYYRSA